MPKKVKHKPELTDFFWDLAEPLLAQDSVDEGSLMGFPCIRVNGDFFCSCGHRTGHLIVKLAKERVQQLISGGVGEPCSPCGPSLQGVVAGAGSRPRDMDPPHARGKDLRGGTIECRLVDSRRKA